MKMINKQLENKTKLILYWFIWETGFQDHTELKKCLDVIYNSTYETKIISKNFMFCISKYLFNGSFKEKLKMVKFVAILCD